MNDTIITEDFTVTIARDRKSGCVLAEIWKDAVGEYHRPDNDEPAVRRFDRETGIEHSTKWSRHGKSHREGDKPAFIARDSNTGRTIQEAWVVNGRPWREDPQKPVLIRYDGETGAIISKQYRVGRRIVSRRPS